MVLQIRTNVYPASRSKSAAPTMRSVAFSLHIQNIFIIYGLHLVHTAVYCVIVCASVSNSAPMNFKNLPTYGELKMTDNQLIDRVIYALGFVALLAVWLGA